MIDQDSPIKRFKVKRVNTPSVLQMEMLECGAACLKMILGHYKKHVPLIQLRIDCGVSRDGSSAANIIKAAAKYNCTGVIYKLKYRDLRALPTPYIALWEDRHFIVIEGFTKKKVYINDPAIGRISIPIEDFIESYSNRVISIRPTDDFKKGGKLESVTTEVKRWFQSYKMELFYLMLTGIALVIPGLIIPLLGKLFIDQYLISHQSYIVKPLLISMTVAIFVQLLLRVLQKHYLLKLQAKLMISKCSAYFWHLFKLPLAFFFQRYPGDLASRLNSARQMCSDMTQKLMGVLVDLFSVTFFLTFMFYFDWQLTVVALSMGILSVIVMRMVTKIRKDKSGQIMSVEGLYSGIATNGLQNIETVKASGRESDFFTKLSGSTGRLTVIQQQLEKTTIPVIALFTFISGVNLALILTYGGYKVMIGDMTMGTLFAFQTLTMAFLAPFSELMMSMGSIQDMFGSLFKYNDVLDYKPSIRLSADEEEKQAYMMQDKDKLDGAIKFDNVSFGYNHLNPPLIKDLSLSVAIGERVAIVGSSGSGKSTIARLLGNLYLPWEGTISIDGIPLKEINRWVFLNSVSFVDQEVFLFEGSISENLSLWDDTIEKSRLMQAAKTAAIHNEIIQRNGGYGNILTENGKNLSGGQRQRIEIARALLNEPSVLILDEATSALDPAIEHEIIDNLNAYGCSMIIIAHRLSTVRTCDRIIVLDHGTIVQEGTHESLMAEGGLYQQLIKMQ